MGIQRTATTAIAGLLTLGLVGACTGGSSKDDKVSGEDGEETTVSMTEVKGAEALRPSSTVIGGWDALVSGTRSTVVAELAGSEGEPQQLFAIDPETQDQRPVGASAPQSWSTATTSTTAVVAGDTTKDHALVPFVRVSTDLRTWKEVPIRYPKSGWSFSEVGLDGDTPLVIADKPDGSTALLRLDEDSPTVHDIPTAKGQEIDPIELVEHRGRLVLLVDEGARGGTTVTRTLASEDGGRTWERGAPMPGAKGTYGVVGLVSTGDQLVATGWANRKAPKGTTGMVWSSPDATTWKRTRATPIGHDDTDTEQPDYHLSHPTLIDGRAAFDQTCDACTDLTRLQWDGENAKDVGEQLHLNDLGPNSGQIPGDAAGVYLENGSLIAFEDGDRRTLTPGEVPGEIDSIDHVGDSTYVSLGHQRFTRQAEGSWNTQTHIKPYVMDGSIRRAPWTPEALEDWSNLETVVEPEGKTTVAAGTHLADGSFRAESRSLSSGRWSSGTGLGQYPYESVTGLAHADDTFFMTLQVQETDATAGDRQTRVYASSDGVDWREEDGEWGPARTASSISDVCELPNGDAFAVGWSQAKPDGAATATTWTRSKGSWTRDVPQLEGAGAEIFACATIDDTTVVTGSVDGSNIEWRTKDGQSFTAREPLPRGMGRSYPHEVEGGLVAAGSSNTKDHVGPIVWFSEDGESWQWAPIDVEHSASSFVETAGEDVYAVTSQDSGDRIWKIDEIATREVTGDDG